MANGRLQVEFEEFAKVCFGDISDSQYIDLRRTFVGGAAALWGLIFKNLSEGDEPSESDLELMRSIETEMKQFNEDVKKGLK